ncbi:hypothetical protein B0H16DRAFT_1463202 [Mycena metata]|uniref:Uncharacterized protein n=1 Tax=Mycena metata TaxID=1033252 RepID=A0AAD7IJI5_9AGAR|nr:hypothetical protein B0H16DRAFT_1463202 [Mycena metata]
MTRISTYSRPWEVAKPENSRRLTDIVWDIGVRRPQNLTSRNFAQKIFPGSGYVLVVYSRDLGNQRRLDRAEVRHGGKLGLTGAPRKGKSPFEEANATRDRVFGSKAKKAHLQTTMAKGKTMQAPSKRVKKCATTQRPEDPQQREKRLKRLAEYRSRPEAREKQRLLIAERRAAVKARRRQWDPPKKIKSMAPDIDAPLASPERPPEAADSPRPSVCGDPSITSAEQVAIHMLLELGDTAGPKPRGTPPPPSEGQEIVAEDPMVPHTSSRHSSLEAVEQAPIRRRPIDAIFITDKLDRHADSVFIDKLPPNASPASQLQKKIQRDLGVLGLLTWVQQAQIHVATLGLPGSLANVEDLSLPVVDRRSSFLTMKSQCIRQWREGVRNEETEGELEWDAEEQRGFAEAALRWRTRRYGTFP